jgi:hypothetical protein
MNKQNNTSNIWSFGHRSEYISRVKIAGPEFGYPKGPYKTKDFHWENIPHLDRSESWNAAYLEELRTLALSYWLGSEYDIALIRKEEGAAKKWATTCVFHEFDSLTHATLQLGYGFKWNDEKACHFHWGEVDYLQLITFLLTYYNAVFFEDTTTGESWINYPGDSVERTPQKIRINRNGVEGRKYVQEEKQIHSLDTEKTGFCSV